MVRAVAEVQSRSVRLGPPRTTGVARGGTTGLRSVMAHGVI